MLVFPPPTALNSYIEILTLNGKVFEGVDFGRRLGHEGRTLLNEISAGIK